MAEHTQNAYAKAGVDTAAGDTAVELMTNSIKATHGPQVYKDASGFAGMYQALELKNMKRPLLSTSTDGVGTKVAIAWAMDVHNTIGQDLVGMVVDDLSPLGAKPLFMTDYIACAKVYPQRIADIVSGIALACKSVDCALVGGETAEHPGLMEEGQYDLAGAATGIVDAGQLLGPARVKETDVLIALASSGLHSNGYSLVRHIFAEKGWSWDRIAQDLPGQGWTLQQGSTGTGTGTVSWGQALLEPTRLYSKLCLDLSAAGSSAACESAAGEISGEAADRELEQNLVHAFAHVTGGGLGANLARVIPTGLRARVNRSSWQVPPLFKALIEAGQVDWQSAEDTWNLGVGMVAVVDQSFAQRCIEMSRAVGIEAWELGDIVSADKAERLLSDTAQREITGTKGVKGGLVTLTGSYL